MGSGWASVLNTHCKKHSWLYCSAKYGEQWHHLVQADLVSVGEQKIQVLERLAQEEWLHHVLGPGVQGVPHVADGRVASAHLAVLLNALQWQFLANELDKSKGHKPEISSTPSPGRSCCPRSSRGTTSSPPSRVWGGSVRRWAANTIVDCVCGDCRHSCYGRLEAAFITQQEMLSQFNVTRGDCGCFAMNKSTLDVNPH